MWVSITYKSSWKYTTGTRWCIGFPWNLAHSAYNWFTRLPSRGFYRTAWACHLMSPYPRLQGTTFRWNIPPRGTSTEHDGCLNRCQITGFLDSKQSQNPYLEASITHWKGVVSPFHCQMIELSQCTRLVEVLNSQQRWMWKSKYQLW